MMRRRGVRLRTRIVVIYRPDTRSPVIAPEWFHAVAQLLRRQSFSLPFASGRDRWP
ncbi:hypothetical protein WAF85_001158 [Salmonella enterica]|uniref:Uncharacterized protein n=1 Tax=Salmonella enterica TaxID=28901 RepID=A0A760MR95_SALER|nr:hypothetical protein [Salmonella enterica subsp. enterica serovar Glostrup]EDT7013498.1 hypothetical protein [Salmonella enterica subsp. enterica serovar Abaetetuba]EDT9981606.1 hypothetical protein [Salmonella enterica]EDV6140094.1 hypothetical protein [Salmonella enterica subsp. enterica]QVA22279.1 hypothetical protein JYM84_14180 [Salmonella enterica subsp. enterica serovar Rubislaw]